MPEERTDDKIAVRAQERLVRLRDNLMVTRKCSDDIASNLLKGRKATVK